MTNERATIGAALTALERSTGISGEMTWEATPPCDGRVRLAHAGDTATFSVEVRGSVRREHHAFLQEQMLRLPQPALLVCDRVTEPQVDELVARGIDFIDTAGNAHITHGAWFVLVKGRTRHAEASAPPAHLSASVWKVAYTLLRRPEIGAAPIRALAEQAGVSAGAASKAIRALDARGWVRNLGHDRALLEPRALWAAWETGWIDRLASKLFITRAEAPAHASLQDWFGWWQRQAPDAGFVGGELGAEALGMDLRAGSATLHVPRWDEALVGSLRLVPAEDGPITVLATFGAATASETHRGVAHPMLVRAALLSTPDERLDAARRELASQILQGLPDAAS